MESDHSTFAVKLLTSKEDRMEEMLQEWLPSWQEYFGVCGKDQSEDFDL